MKKFMSLLLSVFMLVSIGTVRVFADTAEIVVMNALNEEFQTIEVNTEESILSQLSQKITSEDYVGLKVFYCLFDNDGNIASKIYLTENNKYEDIPNLPDNIVEEFPADKLLVVEWTEFAKEKFYAADYSDEPFDSYQTQIGDLYYQSDVTRYYTDINGIYCEVNGIQLSFFYGKGDPSTDQRISRNNLIVPSGSNYEIHECDDNEYLVFIEGKDITTSDTIQYSYDDTTTLSIPITLVYPQVAIYSSNTLSVENIVHENLEVDNDYFFIAYDNDKNVIKPLTADSISIMYFDGEEESLLQEGFEIAQLDNVIKINFSEIPEADVFAIVNTDNGEFRFDIHHDEGGPGGGEEHQQDIKIEFLNESLKDYINFVPANLDEPVIDAVRRFVENSDFHLFNYEAFFICEGKQIALDENVKVNELSDNTAYIGLGLSKQDRIYAIPCDINGNAENVVENVLRYDVKDERTFMFYYGNAGYDGDDETPDIVLNPTKLSSTNPEAISFETDKNFAENVIRVKFDDLTVSTEIVCEGIDDSSLHCEVGMPYYALYSSSNKSPENIVKEINNYKPNEDTTLVFYFMWNNDCVLSEGEYQVKQHTMESQDSVDLTCTKEIINEGKCLKLTISSKNLPSDGEIIISGELKNDFESFEFERRFNCHAQGQGEEGTEETDETIVVNTVQELKDAIHKFSDKEGGTIVIGSTSLNPFVVDYDSQNEDDNVIVFDHSKPNTSSMASNENEYDEGKEKWLKVILNTDVQLNGDVKFVILENTKVIFKSADGNDTFEGNSLTKQDIINNDKSELIHSIIKTDASLGPAIESHGDVLAKNIRVINNNGVGVELHDGNYYNGQYSLIEGSKAIVLRNSNGYGLLDSKGKIAGEDYGIKICDGEYNNQRLHYSVNVKNVTVDKDKPAIIMAGGPCSGIHTSGEVKVLGDIQGFIEVKNGSLVVDGGTILADGPAIQVKPLEKGVDTDSALSVDIAINIKNGSTLISDNNTCISEIYANGSKYTESKISQFVIEGSTYGPNGEYPILIANKELEVGNRHSTIELSDKTHSDGSIDVRSGYFSDKFDTRFLNQLSSFGEELEEYKGGMYYHVADNRDILMEVSDYASLVDAISNHYKNIKLKADIINEGNTAEIEINHVTNIDLNEHVISGYTLNYNYDQTGLPQITRLRLTNGTLEVKDAPVIKCNAEVLINNVSIVDSQNIPSKYDGYAVEVYGTGSTMFNTSTINTSKKGVLLNLDIQDVEKVNNGGNLSFNNATISTGLDTVYSTCNFANDAFASIHVMNNSNITSKDATVFNLENPNVSISIDDSIIEAKEYCVITVSPVSVNDSKLTSNSSDVIYLKENAYGKFMLANEFESKNGYVFKFQNNPEALTCIIEHGAYVGSKGIVSVESVDYSKEHVNVLFKGGTYSHNVQDETAKSCIPNNFECIMVDPNTSAKARYGIARRYGTTTNVIPYLYADEIFELDGNALSIAVSPENELSLIFNAKSLSEAKEFDGDSSVSSYYDLHIDTKDADNNFGQLENSETNSLQTVTIALTPEQQTELQNKNAVVKYIHDGQVLALTVVPARVGETSNAPCAYIKDNKLVVKTYQFCTFALGSTDASLSVEVEKPIINEGTDKEFILLDDEKYHATYDGGIKVFVLSSSPYYEVSGMNESSQVGEHTVTVRLKDKDLYTWEDGTKEDLVYKFVIDKIAVNAPSENETIFSYTGLEQTYALVENDAYTISGNKKTNAGTYTVTVSLKDKSNYEWSDHTTADKAYTFIINKLTVVKPTKASIEEFTYDGNEHTYVLQSVTDSAKYTVEGDRAIAVGEYTVTVSLKDKANTTWVGDSNSNLTFNYTINKAQVIAPTADKTSFVYNGSVQKPTISENSLYTITNSKEIKNVGTSSITISLKDKNNYEWSTGNSDDIVINYEITKDIVDVPSVNANTFTYNGEEHSLDIATNSKYEIKNNSLTNVGKQTVTVSLKDKINTCWNNEGNTTADLTFELTVNPIKINKPNPSVTSFVFDGNAKSIDFGATTGFTVENNTLTNKGSKTVTVKLQPNCVWFDGSTDDLTFTLTVTGKIVNEPEKDDATFIYDGSQLIYTVAANDDYTVTGNKQTNAGTYEVIIALKDKTNTSWAKGGTSDLKYEFVIDKKEINKPQVDTTVFTYTGSVLTYNVATNDDYSVTGNSQTNAGSYDVMIALKDANNTKWKDGDSLPLAYKFVIGKKAVDVPNANTTQFTYTGEVQKYFDADDSVLVYRYLNNTRTVVGSQTVQVELKDTSNYEWSDGIIANKEYTFTIGKAKISHPAADTTEFVFDGTEKTYTIPSSSLYTVSNNKATNVGTTNVIVSLNDTDNYEWSDEKTYTFTIAKLKLNKPAQAEIDEFTYDKTEHTYEIATSNWYTVTGNKQTNAGSYNATVALKDKVNTCWNDDSIDDLTNYPYTINKAKVAIPIAPTETYTYNGSTQTYGLTSTELYNVTENIRKDAGEQNVLITLKDPDNYEWDGILGTYTFTIAKAMPTYTLPIDVYVVKGEALSTIVLPIGFAWVNPETVVDTTEATKIYKISYTPSDTTNYLVVNDISLTVNVIKNVEIDVDENVSIDTSTVKEISDLVELLKTVESYEGLTPEEISQIKGASEVSIKVGVSEITTTIESKEAEKFEEKVSDSSQIVKYFEITLTLIADDTEHQLTNTSSKAIKFAIKIDTTSTPLETNDTTKERVFFVLRNHNGTVTKLGATVDKDSETLTFASGLFSKYAIAFEDVDKSNIPGGNNIVPNTGIN